MADIIGGDDVVGGFQVALTPDDFEILPDQGLVGFQGVDV